jgi:stage III sporulation protein SpoIIIAA
VIEATVRAAGDRAESASLHGLARGLTCALARRADERPFFVELAGTPRAGKTTVLTNLARMLRDRDLRVALVDESASGCPIPDKRSPKFNVWTFCEMLQRVLEAQYA